MSKSRKAYRIAKAGNIKNLKLVSEDIEEPSKGEVQVEIHSIGLNFADIFAILGLYGATPKGSFVPGLEYSGIIISLGEGIEKFKIGDKVMGITRFGAYTSHINIDADYIVPLPEKWSFEEGAAYLVQGLTAYYGMVHLGRLKKGDCVLIHSAAGGVGLMANRIAKKFNAYTIGTVSSESKIEILKQEGYNDWIIRDKNFKNKLHITLNNRDLAIVMECIGGNVFKAGYNALAAQGRLINYGSARYGDNSNSPNWIRLAYLYLTRPKIDPQKMIESNKSIMGFNLIWLYQQKALMHQMLKEMNALKLQAPRIGHVFDFDDMYKAIKLFQSGKTKGKVIVNLMRD
ncbi:MAG: medium chain dehydrogenase/reductase family protein [Cytophagales bacterium]